ncbi:Non-LTR (Long terminal repeat) retrotransposon and domain-containing protein [Elysia marginata]|uniref:Non-LTR (Long terminal repeat) retrotransposon and domain-containing protein n=1 Tax=Elysia marginata TaxID=1093978 RepID=A0AAV4JH26_9GAST|nr:Non-LTR (Long terminal repeat) retrotransposon and domain-containing protein [Elysia marginata]
MAETPKLLIYHDVTNMFRVFLNLLCLTTIYSQQETRRALTRLDMNKAAGPDNIKPRLLKTCSNQLASVFTFIFNWSLTTSTIPLFQTVNNRTGAEETFPRNTE